MNETDTVGGEGDKGEEPSRQRHVLLVEDEELVAMAMTDELQRLGWTVVGPASTLEEAQLLVTSAEHLDAAVLDINLQGRWVHGVVDELVRRGVPFVVCTGYELVDPDGRFAGAPLIPKPMAADRLSATLDELLNQAGPNQVRVQPDVD
jgi:DNA-binding NtrC family response regulator